MNMNSNPISHSSQSNIPHDFYSSTFSIIHKKHQLITTDDTTNVFSIYNRHSCILDYQKIQIARKKYLQSSYVDGEEKSIQFNQLLNFYKYSMEVCPNFSASWKAKQFPLLFFGVAGYNVRLNTKAYNKIMLSESILSQNAQNRRAQKVRLGLHSLLFPWSSFKVDSLEAPIRALLSGCFRYIPYLMACHLFFSSQCITQTANYLRLMPTTSCLARIYFDLFLQANQETDVNACVEIMIACLALAIKFNQKRSVSEETTAESLFKLCSLPFSQDKYFKIEVKIFYALSLRLKYTTPLDYVDILIARFPFFPGLQQVLPGFIELACIHPSACEFSSQQLFFGALLAILQLKGMALGELQTQVLLGMTDGWERSKLVKMRIVDDITVYGV